MKKDILYLTCTALLAIGIIGLLIAEMRIRQTMSNGFKRNWAPLSLKVETKILHNGDILYYSGQSAFRYFFTGRISNRICWISKDFKRKNFFSLQVDTNKYSISPFEITVDSPRIFILCSHEHSIIILDSFSAPAHGISLSKNFDDGIVLSPSTYLLRAEDSSKLNRIFLKVQVPSMKMNYERNISDRTNDLGLSSDGRLIYDSPCGRILYLHYYYNNLFCFDTSLHLIRVGKTLDTVSRNANKAIVYANQNASNSSAAFTGPLKFINWWGDINGDKLYIYSNLKADNESNVNFRENSVIDVFQLPGLHYVYSFYVPLVNGRRMISFKMIKNELLAFYNNELVVYLNENR
jgi:hypothetical protein